MPWYNINFAVALTGTLWRCPRQRQQATSETFNEPQATAKTLDKQRATVRTNEWMAPNHSQRATPDDTRIHTHPHTDKMTTHPEGCPEISTSRRPNDIVAIVTVHHPEAGAVNRSTTYQRMRLVGNNHSKNDPNILGCHILLEQGKENKSSFEFGRSGLTGEGALTLDVYLPHTQIAKKQLTLIADLAANCWRIRSNTETIATVNGVPLQNHTIRTKSKTGKFPHTVYLDQSAANDVQIKDLKVTIWLLKLPSQITVSDNGGIPTVYNVAQNVDNRREEWAQSRYILERDPVQVSEKSFRVRERFTGKHVTAKLFQGPKRGRASRDEEFLMMNKEKVRISHRQQTSFVLIIAG